MILGDLLREDFMNTPMDGKDISRCRFSVGICQNNRCGLLSQKKQGNYMYPCSKLQELICKRALRKASNEL